MQKRIGFALLSCLFLSGYAKADPFGTVDTIYAGPKMLEASFRSDLWSSPNQNKENPLRIYSIQFIRPVIDTDQWKLSLKFKTDGLRIGNAGLAVGNNAIDIGGDLRAESLGFSLEKKYSEGSASAFFASYNSESDEPFKSSRDTALDLGFYHRFVPEGDTQWVAGFDHTKNRGLFNNTLMPLIGVIYKPSPDFVAVVGFPFLRFSWTGAPWHKSLNISPVGLDAQVSHEINEYVTFFARGGVSNRFYMHSQRLLDETRIIFEEKYLEVATSRMVSAQASIETSLGYSFNRKLYEATRVFDPIGNITAIPSDAYATLKMGFKF